MRPDLAPAPVRFLVLRSYPYLLAYEAVPEGRPSILRFLHGARDLPVAMAEPGD